MTAQTNTDHQTIGSPIVLKKQQEISPIDTKQTHGFDPEKRGALWEFMFNSSNGAWRFKGGLRQEVLMRAADELVKRHPILRCGFKYLDGGWRYAAEQAREFSIHNLDASNTGKDAEKHALELLCRAIWRPFCLEVEGTFRIVSVKISDQDYFVGFVIHHSFADIESVRIFSYELATLYDSFCRNQYPILSDLQGHYFDYMKSVEEWRERSTTSDGVLFWLRYLDEVRGFPISHGQYHIAQFKLPRKTSDAIRVLSQAEGIGSNMLLEVAHQITLCRIFNQTDVTTLTVSKGRRQKELGNVIGNFVEIMPSRCRVTAVDTFRQLVRKIRDTRLKSLPYRGIPINFLADRCSTAFDELPIFNFLLPSMLPQGLGVDHLNLAIDSDQMIDSITMRFLVPPPNDFFAPQAGGEGSLPSGNPYIRNLYSLFVVDLPEFEFTCGGDLSEPCNLAELVHHLEQTISAIAAEPDCSLSSLLTA